MYISAGVGGMATVLPVLEPHVQSHYFLDTPCISSYHSVMNIQTCKICRLFFVPYGGKYENSKHLFGLV